MTKLRARCLGLPFLLAGLITFGPADEARGQAPPTPTATGVAPSAGPARPVFAHLANPLQARQRFGVSPSYDDVLPRVDALKVAVLDYGFEGVRPGEGRYLPASVELVEDYDADFVTRNGLGDPEYRKGFEPGNRHGRDMAQVVWAMAGNRPTGPKFYLLNANGPTMLRRAVRYAIDRQVDLILFSGVFEGGGNGDGKGPINRIVDEALARGILWVNASGNYGGHVFEGPVRLLKDGYLKLAGGKDVAAIRFRNRVDENVVTVTLTWDDYTDEEDAGTGQDLDLVVEDPLGRVVGRGDKNQVDEPAGPGARALLDSQSRNPRERVILANLPAFPVVSTDADYAYRIRVRTKHGRFSGTDRLRILVTAARETYVPPGSTTPRPAVEFLDASNRAELYPPADHPGVLTIGDAGGESSVGPTLDHRLKPDAVVLDSRADFSDGSISAGSSNAAAYVAGIALVLKANNPRLTVRDLLAIARGGPKVDARLDRAKLGLREWKTPARSR